MKKLLSILLVFVLVFSSVPVTGIADMVEIANIARDNDSTSSENIKLEIPTSTGAATPTWEWNPVEDGYSFAGATNISGSDNVEYATFTVTSVDCFVFPTAYPGALSSSSLGAINATASKYMIMRYRTTAATAVGEILAEANGGIPGTALMQANIAYIADGQWHDAVVDLSGQANWSGNIDWFRLDVLNNMLSGSIDIAFVAFFTSSADATTWAATQADPVEYDITNIALHGPTLKSIQATGSYNIDSTTGYTPLDDQWTDAGFWDGSNFVRMGYNNFVYLGDYNFENVEKVVIQYHTDGSIANDAGRISLGLSKTAASFGWDIQTPNYENAIVYGAIANQSGEGWPTVKTLTITSGIDTSYNGPVYLTSFQEQGELLCPTSVALCKSTTASGGEPDICNISVDTVSNGTVTVDKTTGIEGDMITVTAIPDTGYELGQILVNGSAITGNTFVLAGNSLVTATFTSIFLYTEYTGGYILTDCSTNIVGDVVIPSMYDGKSVTSIGAYAFSNCSSLTSVTIPDSVTNIDYNAFSNCSSLTSITIPDSVTRIAGDAFYGTGIYNTTSNWVNNVLYIDNWLINAKTSLSGAYVIKDGTIGIADQAFYNCSRLTSITIPDSVTSIGFNAFRACSSLTSITIPDSVTSIRAYTFFCCSSLTCIMIPDSVTSIGEFAFVGCAELTSILISQSVIEIDSGSIESDVIICGMSGSFAETYARENGNTFLHSVGDINNSISWRYFQGVLYISGTGAMERYGLFTSTPWYHLADLITSVEIESGITYVGTYSFYGSKNLVAIGVDGKDLTFGKYSLNAKNLTVYGYVGGTLEEYCNQNGYTFIKFLDKPNILEYTHNKIVVEKYADCLYSLDGVNWQTENTFYNLNESTDYSVYIRRESGLTPMAMRASEATVVTTSAATAPTAPIFVSWSDNVVVLTATDGYEYSLDGITWQSSNVFENISYDTLYCFYQRVADTDTESASQSSPAAKIIIPSAPVILEIGASNLTIEVVDGYEYSLDKIFWYTSDYFDMLIEDFDYTVYCRPVSQSYLFQVVSDGTTVTTYPPVPDITTSIMYTVNDSNISGIDAGTEVSVMVDSLNTSQFCKVYQDDVQVPNDTNVGTGMEVKVMDGKTELASYTAIVNGDLDGDGAISIADASMAMAGLRGTAPLSDASQKAVSGYTGNNGTMNILDVMKLLSAI